MSLMIRRRKTIRPKASAITAAAPSRHLLSRSAGSADRGKITEPDSGSLFTAAVFAAGGQ